MSEPQKLPAEWDEAAVKGVIAHYDGQTEDEEAAEIEAALAGEVRAMIARKQRA